MKSRVAGRGDVTTGSLFTVASSMPTGGIPGPVSSFCSLVSFEERVPSISPSIYMLGPQVGGVLPSGHPASISSYRLARRKALASFSQDRTPSLFPVQKPWVLKDFLSKENVYVSMIRNSLQYSERQVGSKEAYLSGF